MTSWERLWDRFIQEEIRHGSKNGGQHYGDDEENVSLSKKGKKKSKKGSNGGNKKNDEEKKDMNKVKCFSCHMIGNYVVKCPNKKKK